MIKNGGNLSVLPIAVHAIVYINYLPGIAPTVFIRPNTLPECFGARSEGLTAIALLWKPEPPIINARQSMAFSKLSTFAMGNMYIITMLFKELLRIIKYFFIRFFHFAQKRVE